MPSSPVIHAQLLNDYRVRFQIPPLSKTVILNILDKKSAYDKENIYHNGNLRKPLQIMINPLSYFQPVVEKGGKTILQGIQQISGLYHADVIANVFWDWQWTSHGWKLISVAVRP